MSELSRSRLLSPLGSAVALSLALVVLFAVCAVAELIAPGLQVTHAWVSLFTLFPVTSPQAWLEGLFYSVIMGIVAGGIFATAHNAVSKRGL